ncbi:unnamed protein product [Rotaria sp. Silwood2]|nr:unnamed protein product [Rotaria sp. Silwood2]CAF3850856.1 unnamed protein product [Rotaria sp. Silwood2]
MLFKSSVDLLIYFSILFIINKSTYSNRNFSKRFKRQTSDYQVKCSQQSTAVDQVIQYNKTEQARKKRFVLFPEFVNYKDDWRYINRPQEFVYWIANFYPNRINTSYIHQSINYVIQEINTVIDNDITIQEAVDPGEANFHFNFFDYSKCPLDDVPEATIDNVQILDMLYIYSAEITRQSRYRAHGGIHLAENDRAISTIKFNMQQEFLVSNDFVYDPIIYSCIEETNECEIDLHWALLHETLHGFGIEHTTNAEKPVPPNPHMQSVMHFSTFRMLCHDDIRAIRMVYKFPVKRENAAYDDTCRRDFPMTKLQKSMFLFGRMLMLGLLALLIASLVTFILTLIYILLRYLCNKNSLQFEKQTSSISTSSGLTKDKKPMISGQRKLKPHAYLWHDEML